MVIKAYLRRGLAYEQLEKFLDAKNDMLSVKQLQATNKQASDCLNRCNKAIKDIYGDNVPEQKKRSPIKLAEPAADKPAIKETTKPEVVEQHRTDQDEIKAAPKDEPALSIKELGDKILEFKDLGNASFKKKDYDSATGIFGSGIQFYMRNSSQIKKEKDLLTKVS